MKNFFLFAFAFIVSVSQAAEPVTDGNSLAEGLRLLDKSVGGSELTSSEVNSAYVSASYVDGFLDGCGVSWAANENLPFQWPKEGLKPSQFLKIVEKYIKDHPERLHLKAKFFLFLALRDSFPNHEYKAPNSP
jgi:Ssp1 endopeptidase immunity protein Rap1a